MAKRRQTRRSISVKGLTYQWVQDYCNKTNQSISGFVEDLIAAKMDELGEHKPHVLRPRNDRRKKEVQKDEIVSQHFTF
jgi:hypothetical protein